MLGREQFERLITPAEALKISEASATIELCIADELYKEFKRAHCGEPDDFWFFMRLLTHEYVAGRVQGIREERKKARKKRERSN